MNDIDWYIDNKLTHQIHTSERKAFRACRRRHNWVYNEFYYPRVTPEPLEMGVALHKGMEYYYNPDTWNDKEIAKNLALVAFRRSCEEQQKNYKRMHGELSNEKIEEYRARIELGLNMLKYYFEEVAPQYDQGFTPIRVEVGFELPLMDPDTSMQIWCHCKQCEKRWSYKNKNEFHGLPVTYGGRLDMLAQDDKGRYWIFDWKSTSRILDEDAESSFLQLDDQITSYCWALWRLGIEVAGFVYVELKKTYPKPPEMLSRPYKGKMFSTNKTNLTNRKLFTSVVQTFDPEAYSEGLYDDYLNWLDAEGPKFTQRHQVHRNIHELENAGDAIAYEAMDITQNPRIYPQPGRFSCTTCLFRQPCLGMNMNEDYKYTLETMFEVRKYHYWEEEEPSTE